MKKLPRPPEWDPHDYNSTIKRADGQVPYNGFLWPTESWWLDHDLPRMPGTFHFGIVALNDGCFSTYGSVHCIRENRDPWGMPCVFPDREAAIRSGAARCIQTMRASRKWTGILDGRLQGSQLAEAINWARAIVARTTGTPMPKPVQIQDPPPPRTTTGLPLFDFATTPPPKPTTTPSHAYENHQHPAPDKH